MKSSALFAVAAAAATASAQLRFPFSRHQSQHSSGTTASVGRSTGGGGARRGGRDDGHNNHNNRRSRNRQRTPPLQITSDQYTYVVNASIGTPPQALTLGLTISADETWVPDADDEYGTAYDWGYGVFSPDNSSTLVRLDEDDDDSTFYSTYADGQYAYGDRARDTLRLGVGDAAVTLPNLTFGLAESTSSMMGLLALGFNDSSRDVPNVPDCLLAEGLVNSTAYSLWLDDEDAATGSVLFGAVDRAAFTAPLIRFPILDSTDWYYLSSGSNTASWGVRLASFNYTRSTAGTQQPLVQNQTAVGEVAVSVDPTFSVSTLPRFLAQPIWDLAGAHYDENAGLALVPCAASANLTARLSLQLYGPDGPVLVMPVRDLVLEDAFWGYDDDTDVELCVFGVQNATYISSSSSSSSWDDEEESGDWSLGAPMLKRMYTVFDLANREMGFAPVNFDRDADAEDVVPFPNYGAEIPESTLAAEQCDDSYRYCPGNTGSGGRSSSDDYDPGMSGAPLVGAVIGGIVGGTLVVLGIVWGALACARRRQMARLAAADQEKGKAPETSEQAPALPPRPLPVVSSDAEATDVPQQTGAERAETSRVNAGEDATPQIQAKEPEVVQPNTETGEASQVDTAQTEAALPSADKVESSQIINKNDENLQTHTDAPENGQLNAEAETGNAVPSAAKQQTGPS